MQGTAQTVRKGGFYLQVPNSGLEVWLYDDANRRAIRAAKGDDEGCGGMPPCFAERTREGLVVGYGLVQDDDLELEVHVGDPLTEAELSIARWLEPQSAFLRLPSGRFCLESNDASRIGPGEPGETGARVNVPAGDYRLTLYRIDHEALNREGLTWDGAQEVIVLTPGGTPDDAATTLLPFEPRRDLSWVGRYTIAGQRAHALAWFRDDWDTMILNLDAAAAARLGLVPGSVLKTFIAAADLTLYSTFGESWKDAKLFAPPADADRNEYGYAAFCEMSDWDGATAMFCRRETSKKKVPEKCQNLWIPVVVEVLGDPTSGRPREGA
jgi:hypothetical protein